MPQISNNCMHLGLRVRDYQATMAFYHDAMGFEEVFTLTMRDFYETMSNSEDGKNIQRTKPDDTVWLTYLRIKDEQYLEIFPVEPEEIIPADPRASFFHFSLQVDDIDKAVAQLKEKGVTVYNLHIDALENHPAPEPFKAVTGRCGSRLAWIKDPDGNLIEVMELTEDSMQRKLDGR